MRKSQLRTPNTFMVGKREVACLEFHSQTSNIRHPLLAFSRGIECPSCGTQASKEIGGDHLSLLVKINRLGAMGSGVLECGEIRDACGRQSPLIRASSRCCPAKHGDEMVAGSVL